MHILSEPIYSRDSKGKLRAWQYEVEDDKWRTIAGLVDGRKVASEWRLAVAASQVTDTDQAIFEARAAEKKKLERKYAPATEGVDEARASGYKPMLATKYERWTGPCYSQPKLDGIRCLASRDGLWSRAGKPIVSCPHVERELSDFFDRLPDAVLDGELYNHALRDDFNAITSIVKKTLPTDEDLEKSAALMQYHVYDVPNHPGNFSERIAFLREQMPFGGVTLVVATSKNATEEDLDSAYSMFIGQGYEGQMVRLDEPYEGKRSKYLMKRKEFFDEEYEFVAFEEGKGNWGGLPKSVVARASNGREFGAGIKGTREHCASLIGTSPATVTVRSPNMTPDGVPRFGIAVAFHDTLERVY